MRVLTTILGVIASLILLGVSGAMNYLFLSSLGKTAVEAHVLGAASAAADMLKALLPFFIAWGWRAGRYAVAVPGTMVWLFFAGFSLLSAIGFAADNRQDFSHSRESLNAAYQSALQDLKAAEAKHRTIPKHRLAAIVSEEIERHKQDRRWSSTKSCTDATLPESRDYCGMYFKLRAELASGIETERIKRQIDGLKAETGSLRASGAGQDVDPQVSLLAGLFGHAESDVRLTLIIIVAVLVEIGSALGLFLSVNHGALILNSKVLKAKFAGQPQDSRLPDIRPAAASRSAEIQSDQVGDVVDFCLECLWPTQNGGITLNELFAAYQQWCLENRVQARRTDEFNEMFENISSQIGLCMSSGLCKGIYLRKTNINEIQKTHVKTNTAEAKSNRS